MMKKILILILCLCSFFTCNYVEALSFDVTSKNIILYNMKDNNVIYEKNSNDKVQIASLTKIMTTLVAIENIKNLDEEIVIDYEVFEGIEEYAQAGFKPFDKVTYKDLLYGVMLPSGADAVRALVLNLNDNEDVFVKLMNDKAKQLNLKNTKFDNPIGMDSSFNYSTAQDLATLLIYALKNDTFREIYTTKSYKVDSANLSFKSTLLSYAKTLDVSNILGAKSGFTDGAGLCLASIGNFNDVNYLLIVLGADTNIKSNAVRDSLEIYNYYAKNYSYRTLIKNGQVLKKVDVKWGKKKTYEIKSTDDIDVYLKNDVKDSDIEYSYTGIEELTYKNKKGDKLGTIVAKYDDQVLVSYDVYLTDALNYYHPVIYSIIIVSIIMMILSLWQLRKKKKRKKKRKKSKKN